MSAETPFGSPVARLAARLLEGGFHPDLAETTARTAVRLARGILRKGADPEAVYAEALAIVLDAADEAGDEL